MKIKPYTRENSRNRVDPEILKGGNKKTLLIAKQKIRNKKHSTYKEHK